MAQKGRNCRPVDDDWLIQSVEDAAVRISNNHTGHGTLLAWDQIHHYATDPDRGGRNGFFDPQHPGQHRWEFPVVRADFPPRRSAPDSFGDIRGWKRENDPLYFQNLYA